MEKTLLLGKEGQLDRYESDLSIAVDKVLPFIYDKLKNIFSTKSSKLLKSSRNENKQNIEKSC